MFREVGPVHNLTQSLQGMEFKGTGIAHTRWATRRCHTTNLASHIKISQIIVVHNGIIENATFLREKLKQMEFLYNPKRTPYFTDIGKIFMQERAFW